MTGHKQNQKWTNRMRKNKDGEEEEEKEEKDDGMTCAMETNCGRLEIPQTVLWGQSFLRICSMEFSETEFSKWARREEHQVTICEVIPPS